MTLSLKNIGKIKNADVEIKGITVIAGENNTGKSTVGKVLFSMFNGLFNVKQQILEQKVSSITDMFNEHNEFAFYVPPWLMDDIANRIIENAETLDDVDSTISGLISWYNEEYDDFIEIEPISESQKNQISEILSVSDDKIMQNILNIRIHDEFHSQLNNLYSTKLGCITLKIKGTPISIKIKNNNVQEIKSWLTLKTDTVYIDNPFIMDEISKGYIHPHFREGGKYHHKNHLISKLMKERNDMNIINGILVDEKFELIFKKIGLVSNDVVIKPVKQTIRLKAGDNEPLNIKNLSTGMKTFLLIKTLLSNGTIQRNGTIILDEPEIHLHPAWQLYLAELIVLIQKEFNMHILLTTHSPYFLRAIQVYSAKHKIADKCKYYLSELLEDDTACIADVSHDIEQIYSKLAQPFQTLEDDRWADD